MNRTAMFIAISGTLRPVPAEVIAPKDWRASNNAAATDSVATVALPLSVTAGDYCVVGLTTALLTTTPDGWDTQYQDEPSDGSLAYAVLSKVLTASDVAVGSVAVTMGAASRWAALAIIWQAGKISGVDVKSTANPVQGNLFAPFTLTANEVTTSVADTQLLAIFHTFVSSGYSAAPLPESGWGVQSSFAKDAYYEYGVTFAYKGQTAAGATGAVTATDSATSGHAVQSAVSLLLALKPAAPGITLDISLPSGTVGSAYSGYIHGTNVYGATGTITYSADALPDGVSLDSTTGAVTASELTTDTTTTPVTTTYTVSNGNTAQDQTYQQVWDIAAALTLPNVVQSAPSVNTSRQAQITLPAAPTVGNWLVMLAAYNASSGRVMTPPDSSWVSKLLASGTTPTAQIFVHQVVEGDGTYYAFVCGAPNQDQVGVMYEVANTSGVGAVGNSSDVAGMTVQTATASSAITNGLALAAYASSGSGMGSLSASSGWTPGPTSTGIYGYSAIAAFTSDDTDPAASITVTHVFKTGVVSLVVMKP